MVKRSSVSLNMFQNLSFCWPAAAPIGATRCLPARPRPAICSRIGKLGFGMRKRPLLGRMFKAKTMGFTLRDQSTVGIVTCSELSWRVEMDICGAAPLSSMAIPQGNDGARPDETGEGQGFVVDAGAFTTKASPLSAGRAFAVTTVNRGPLPLATLRKELPSHAFDFNDCPEPAARAGHRLRLIRSTRTGVKELSGRS